MTVGVRMIGPSGNSIAVSPDGELRASAVADKSKFQSMDATGTAFNFFLPIAGQQFCITLIYYRAGQSVNPTTDADIVIYQDDTIDGTTVAAADILHQDAIVKAGSATLPALLLVDVGKFVNAKTSDATISMTIMGHYVKERE